MPELPARQWVSAGKQAPGSAEPIVGLSSFTPLPNPVLSPRPKPLCLPWRPPKPRAETSLCSPAPVRSEHHQLLPEPASFGPSLLPQREENGKTETPTEELGSAKNGAKLHRAREPGGHTQSEKAGLSGMGKGALFIRKAAQTQTQRPLSRRSSPKRYGGRARPLSAHS